MSAFRLVPHFLRDFMTFVTPRALEVIQWRPLLFELSKAAKRVSSRDQVEEMKREFSDLRPEGLHWGEVGQGLQPSGLNESEKREFGQIVLQIYFLQIYKKDSWWIDLRSNRFAMIGEKFNWDPNGLWYAFSSDFVLGVRTLYDGFYEKDETKFDEALGLLKMIPEGAEPEKVEELKSLFRAHFGDGDQSAMKFEVSHFYESFHNIFEFFVENKVKLQPEFLFLGIYLIGLYLTLEDLGVELDVSSAFYFVKAS